MCSPAWSPAIAGEQQWECAFRALDVLACKCCDPPQTAVSLCLFQKNLTVYFPSQRLHKRRWICLCVSTRQADQPGSVATRKRGRQTSSRICAAKINRPRRNRIHEAVNCQLQMIRLGGQQIAVSQGQFQKGRPIACSRNVVRHEKWIIRAAQIMDPARSG